MRVADYKLLVLFLLITATLLIRVLVEQTGYCSHDSYYYLKAAQNIILGKRYYQSDFLIVSHTKTAEINKYLTTWPAGYSLLIAGFAFVFFLPVFWAAKMVNIFFLGLCFLLFRKIQKDKAYMLGLIFCSFTFLEIFSYTWSEGPFLFGLLWFVFSLSKYLQNYSKTSYLIQLFCSALLLFLIRYIGGFSFIIIASFSGFLFITKKYRPAINLLILFVILSFLAGLYFYNNYLQTGIIIGGGRLDTVQESTGLFLWHLFTGLLNEFSIIRNYYWRGEPANFYIAAFLFQAIILFLIYYKYLKGTISFSESIDNVGFLFTVTGFTYLVIIVFLRFLSPTFPFDYRILSPFTFCLFTALMLYLIQPEQTAKYKGAYNYIIFLFSASLILNLPKEYLISYFQDLFQQFFT